MSILHVVEFPDRSEHHVELADRIHPCPDPTSCTPERGWTVVRWSPANWEAAYVDTLKELSDLKQFWFKPLDA